MIISHKAPPVYRPVAHHAAGPLCQPQQNHTRGIQLKIAGTDAAAPKLRPGPPVYRPQFGPTAQPKTLGNFRIETRPAPPVYRPQNNSSIMRSAPAAGTVAPRMTAPPAVYRPDAPRLAPAIRSGQFNQPIARNATPPVYRPLAQPAMSRMRYGAQAAVQRMEAPPSSKSVSSSVVSSTLPVFFVKHSLWPNIYAHTQTYFESLNTTQVVLTYMGEEFLTSQRKEMASLSKKGYNLTGVATSRDLWRWKSKLTGIYYGSKTKPSDGEYELDEFPYASTLEGGDEPSVSWVSKSENSSHGGALSGFYQSHRMEEGDQFIVKLSD